MGNSPETTCPPGKLAVTITTLQMFQRPDAQPQPAPVKSIEIVHVPTPSVALYRTLYNGVGEEWLWGDRRRLSDDELAKIISHPDVDRYVLYVDNQPAGYAELDGRCDGEIELAYFGFMPGFTGKKLGARLLAYVIQKVWQSNPRRFWVKTCSLDHPVALGFYQKFGFAICGTKESIWDDPRSLGLISENVAPHHPIQR